MRTAEAASIHADSSLYWHFAVTFPHKNGSTDVYGHRDESHEAEDVSIFRHSSLYADVYGRTGRFTTQSTGRYCINYLPLAVNWFQTKRTFAWHSFEKNTLI